ncbi:MAG: sigma-70 family RNA polymerase sigma factor [Anaerolineales bacterium]|nr:sigma-70 family RNA polymerase sigma factor [Anaerolineales bacterium]
MITETEITQTRTGMVQTVDWEAIYFSEMPRVYNFFIYRTGDRESAQDLTATTFERAWRKRSRYRSILASPATWLFAIAKNVLREHLRKVRLNHKKLEPDLSSDDLPSTIDLENSIQQHQEKERLRRLLLDLPEREQDLIAMKYGAGLTNREIARLTRLSETNVGSILHRTVKGLRSKWEIDHGR